jgi:hypothetical protein
MLTLACHVASNRVIYDHELQASSLLGAPERSQLLVAAPSLPSNLHRYIDQQTISWT